MNSVYNAIWIMIELNLKARFGAAKSFRLHPLIVAFLGSFRTTLQPTTRQAKPQYKAPAVSAVEECSLPVDAQCQEDLAPTATNPNSPPPPILEEDSTKGPLQSAPQKGYIRIKLFNDFDFF